MAKVFLDANKLIDLVEDRGKTFGDSLDKHFIFISPLSVHILLYITKSKVPYQKLEDTIQDFSIVDFDQNLCDKSLLGPTADFEDNVQLNTAAQSECDLFLTSDKKLLNLKFFGKSRIQSSI